MTTWKDLRAEALAGGLIDQSRSVLSCGCRRDGRAWDPCAEHYEEHCADPIYVQELPA